MKIPNAIHKFVLHKKKKKYGKYVCTSSYRNKQKTNSRKSMLQLAKNYFSVVYPQNIVHNPIINVQKPGETPRKTSSCNWGLPGFQLATAEPAIDNRRARNWKTKLYM